MATQIQAEAIHEAVRSFFKHQWKSSNKYYPTGHEKYEQRKHGAIEAVGKIAGEMSMKQVNRNLHQYGNYVARQPPGERAGNCMDMAAMAMALTARIPDFGKPWLCSLRTPGDHAFCLITPYGRTIRPFYRNVLQMSSERNSSAWVVDPWSNTCCRADQYYDAFYNKMMEWQVQGKQIRYDGPDRFGAARTALTLPLDVAYIAAFRHSVLKYRGLQQGFS